ncbi:phosphomannomutase [Rhizobium sp. ARZ01]|uniref:phosphomannomutase n=1 Tax=Rhizobium sp. ARZ01 TaxID=2769313 RepID=UPI00177D7031|nr:phosphomannomutase [Rhizobium sp. ARZ01]MBD9374228.1 phosphomannomutase [Rhizobium sp. ARZ01]
MSLKFGTSGLRGLSSDLEGPPAALYATAFAGHLLQSGLARAGDAILVGRDFRPSSPAIAAIVIGALRQVGFEPFDCGTIPTPALALLGLKRRAASLMITGSHIPADRNGIKFYRPDGEIGKADEAAIMAIAESISAAGAIEASPAAAGDASHEAEALFLERYAGLLPSGTLKGLRIGVYQHSTVARDLFVTLLTSLGAECVALGRSDIFIPVDTEAVSADTIDQLRRWVYEHRLDAIVSADGDGDRPLVADEAGIPLRGDLLGLIAANFLGADVVATPVTSNSGIEAAGRFKVLRTRVGSPFVIAAMEEAVANGAKAVVGFEANGGTLTATPCTVNGKVLAALPTRDSFLPALAVLALAAERGEPLSAVASSFHLPVAAADRLENYPIETSAPLMTMLRSGPGAVAAFLAPIGIPARISDIDGLRVTLADKRIIHFRPSGNAPEMRCYVEAATDDAAQTLLHQGLTLIRDWAAR